MSAPGAETAAALEGLREADAPLVVGPGARFEGLLSFRGSAIVEGELRGAVIADGTLWIGESAVVEARVEVDELIVAGTLRGDARARTRIELCAQARVHGKLKTPRLQVAEGSTIEGRFQTGASRGKRKR